MYSCTWFINTMSGAVLQVLCLSNTVLMLVTSAVCALLCMLPALHVNTECCRAVSHWKFQQNGVDLGMVDPASTTRGAQLGDTSTFIALGRNR